MTMIQLIYVSTATRRLPPQELTALLAKVRVANAGVGVTGMLLYDGGTFLQVLEGEVAAVEGVFDKIQHDRRHNRIVLLARLEVTERNFPDWSMGFADVTGKASQLIGYRHVGELTGLVGNIEAIRRVVHSFRDGRWNQTAA